MQISLFPDASLLAIVVIFFLNYLIVRKFFFKPINEVLEAREAETRTAEQAYEEAMARFNEAAAEMESQLRSAKRDAAAVRDRHRADASAHRTTVMEKTQTEARKVIAAAESTLDSDVKEAREKITRESESLAKLAVERILGRAV